MEARLIGPAGRVRAPTTKCLATPLPSTRPGDRCGAKNRQSSRWRDKTPASRHDPGPTQSDFALRIGLSHLWDHPARRNLGPARGS
jgi:hypothetical protein